MIEKIEVPRLPPLTGSKKDSLGVIAEWIDACLEAGFTNPREFSPLRDDWRRAKALIRFYYPPWWRRWFRWNKRNRGKAPNGRCCTHAKDECPSSTETGTRT